MPIADLRARLVRSAWSLGVASSLALAALAAGCSSLIGVPDVPQPADGGEDAASSTSSPDSSPVEGAADSTDAPAVLDGATPAVDAGGG